jgi:hypothetical protein
MRSFHSLTTQSDHSQYNAPVGMLISTFTNELWSSDIGVRRILSSRR